MYWQYNNSNNNNNNNNNNNSGTNSSSRRGTSECSMMTLPEVNELRIPV